MSTPESAPIAVAWFLEQDWARWRTIDPKMQPDYPAWRDKMEAALRVLTQRGQPFEKVILDPDKFLAWSKTVARGQVDGPVRAEYAADVLAQRYGFPPRA